MEIKYVCGLEGSNIMMLKRSDVKAIVDILLGTETADEDFQLDELSVSVVCEVMNQMMGAAATAMSDFLGRMVNISTPESFEMDDLEKVKQEHFPVQTGPVVVVSFKLNIEGIVESEFMNVMSVDLVKELVAGFGLDLAGAGADSGAGVHAEFQARPVDVVCHCLHAVGEFGRVRDKVPLCVPLFQGPAVVDNQVFVPGLPVTLPD